MRNSILPLLCLLAACGPSEVEVAEAERAKTRTDTATSSAGEAPVDLGDGLVLTVLARGGGDFVRTGGRVRVHYTADVVAVGEPEVDAEAEVGAEASIDVDVDPATEVEGEADTAPATESGTAESESDESESDESESDESESDEIEATETETDTDAAEADAVPAQTADSDVTEEAVAQAEESDAPTAEVTEAPADEPAFPRRFDSSHARGVPDVWDLSRTASPRLIEGLRRGLVGLTAGSRVTLRVPAALAWGEEGLPSSKVPPRADVLYEIALLEVLP